MVLMANSRPVAWIENLEPEAQVDIEARLGALGLGGELAAQTYRANPRFVALTLRAGAQIDAEGNSPALERAEVALREAGYGMEIIRRAGDEGWEEPWLQVFGRQPEGPGPKTWRRVAQGEELNGPEL